jgi:O-antigen ligase
MISAARKFLDEYHKNLFLLIANYLLIFYAFFLPISREISNSIFVLILISFFLINNIKERLCFALGNKVIQAAILLFLIHLVWLWGTEYYEYAFVKIDDASKLLYLIIFASILEKRFTYKIISSYLAAIFLSEIFSYLIFFEIINPINNATASNPVSFLLNHTSYAIALALALAGSLVILFSENKNIKYYILPAILIISISINIFIIGSRLGYIIFSLVIFIFIFLSGRKYLFKKIFLGILLVLVSYIFAYYNFNTFKNRSDQMVVSKIQLFTNKDFTTSLGIRAGYHYFSLKNIEDYILFGKGTGDHIRYMIQIISNSTYKEPKPMIDAISSGAGAGLHSDYLDILIQFGFFGFFSYCLFLFSIFKYKQSDTTLKKFQLLILAIIIINGFPQGMLYFTQMSKIFLLLLSTTFLTYDANREQK